MGANLICLSKVLVKALRHTPEEFELEADDDGWVSSDALIQSLQGQCSDLHSISESHFAAIIAESDKPRYEMHEGRIRALYGHFTPKKLAKTPSAPPEILYHGSNKVVLSIIMEQGLKPMSRQYVHFSVDV